MPVHSPHFPHHHMEAIFLTITSLLGASTSSEQIISNPSWKVQRCWFLAEIQLTKKKMLQKSSTSVLFSHIFSGINREEKPRQGPRNSHRHQCIYRLAFFSAERKITCCKLWWSHTTRKSQIIRLCLVGKFQVSQPSFICFSPLFSLNLFYFLLFHLEN